ncbi:hypothetical protein NQ318_001188 [Aromia moschata]|uniref:Uncharacterized protein n=1 Tax=Aromia moschata TaxID=1265417 RepID=A0AAV8ZHM5_9CUCU|nr:hypothetical protein NQ318_001188 [Aromia moschata]
MIIEDAFQARQIREIFASIITQERIPQHTFLSAFDESNWHGLPYVYNRHRPVVKKTNTTLLVLTTSADVEKGGLIPSLGTFDVYAIASYLSSHFYLSFFITGQCVYTGTRFQLHVLSILQLLNNFVNPKYGSESVPQYRVLYNSTIIKV